MRTRRRLPIIVRALALATTLAPIAGATLAHDDEDSDGAPDVQSYAFHGQATVIEQAVAGFHSPYVGENSLWPAARGRETATGTLMAGAHVWPGGEVWADGELVQGVDLSGSKGVAGFLDGEAPRDETGGVHPRLQRLFLRQTIGLGGARQAVEDEEDTLNGERDANRVVLTIGRFSVADIFDLNDFAHDSREDFLNGSVIAAGTFDFAADLSGYTYGGAGELYEGGWTFRLGLFALPTEPGGDNPDASFRQFQTVAEVERRYRVDGRDGSLKLTVFDTHAAQGAWADAVALAEREGDIPQVDAVRRTRDRLGASLNLQQKISGDLGLFARAGWADGRLQGYSFSDIDRTVAAGLSLKGQAWGREDDTVGIGGALNFASDDFTTYLDKGGLGLVIGDGQLPHPGAEGIVEAFYEWAFSDAVQATFDYQLVNNPGYNRDRGPVSLFALRLHAAL